MTMQMLDGSTGISDAEWAEIVDALTRHEFLTGGAALGALGVVLAACGTSSYSAGSAATGWTFTDDLGRRINLPTVPRRVASLTDPTTATLWSLGLHVVATQLQNGNRPLLRAAGVPTDITAIGTGTAGQINLEKLAAVKPGLLVDNTDGKTLSISSGNPHLAKIAPIVGLNEQNLPINDSLATATRLVSSLGVQTSGAVKATKERYQTATGALRRALATKPGLRIMFCFSTGTQLAVYVKEDWGFMKTLAGLGAHFTPAKGEYFQEYSWEDAPGLPADLVVWMSNSALPTNPAWHDLPAVKAGQVVDDSSVTGIILQTYTYQLLASQMTSFAGAVGKAKAGVGPR